MITHAPAISLDKVASTPSSNSAGGTIRYTFNVANTGNVTLNTIRVFDNKLNQTLTISGSLAPGQSTSTIGTYTLTQADIDAGQVINTATVSALSPNSVAATSNDSVSTTINRTPAISLDKVAGTPSSNSAGGTIRYTFNVANTGNVTLNTIRVFDNKLNQTLTISGSLAPGQSASTIGTYTLTQADIDAGQVINTATVSALSPNSVAVTSNDSVSTTINRTPAISLDKVAGTPSSNSAGGTIRYTFTVANTGNVSLNTLRVFDNKLNQTLTISGSLAPGQSTSTIGTYTLTQADIDAGQVINTATVSALSPNSVAVTSNDSVSTTINRTPAISLDKVAGTPSSSSAGGTIRYTFTVANTGNVNLDTIRVFDNKLNQTLTISGSLAPGQSASTIGTYTLTQADIDAGQVINTATVSALSPNSVAVTSNDSVSTTINRTPAISLDKVAGTPSSNSAGGTIRYTFTVANTGNVSLNTLRVFDNKLNQTLTISGSLAPGQSTSTIGTYTLTQADIDAGQVINTATVSALSPNSVAVTSSDSVLSNISRTPAITLDKVAGTPSSNSAGGTIRYTFTVANTGNVSLNTLRVFDNKLNQTLTISGSLAPGQSTSTIGTYTLTQADIDAGQVINTATVSALSPNSVAVTSSDSVLSNISRTPAITLDKVAGTPSSNSAGGTIRYTFTVANTGNVSLNTLRVFDNKLNQTLTISGSLAPGQSTSTIGTYTLTQADIDAGQVINTATVSALSPNSVAVTSNDSVSTTINRTPAISLDKVAGTPSSNSAGGTIRYTFTVANTGNVSLNTLRVFDNKLNQTLTISGSLAPGQSTSTIGTYTLTQADIDAGQVINTATVSALSPNSVAVTSNDSVSTTINRTPAISLDKVAGTPSSNSAGGTIRYTFTVANTGNVSLNTLRVFDNKLNQTLTISGSLAPGQSTSTIGTYTLTQADIDAGQVINTATVSALSPNSVAVTSSDSVLSNISRTPAITLDKVAGTPSSNSAGGTIRYTFTVANTGNVSLNTLRVFDNKLNQTLTISGSLAPGQSTSTIGTYTLTQADIDAGQVINTATVSALSPNSVAVTSNDSVSTTINRTPAISLDKVAGTPSSSSAGGTIRYTFTVANTGNVSLNTLRVFDNKLNQTLTISGSLAPGQSTSTIGTYTLTQADIDAGQVINTATVSALSPNSVAVTSSDSVLSNISRTPAITLDKVAGTPSSNSAGGTIRYTFTVANTGNVSLNTLRVFDNKLNQTLTISGSLAPGQSTSTIGTYTLTQADIDAGQVINTATVSALSPNSVAVTSNDSVSTTINRTPAISLDKVAGTPSSNSAGGTIRYTFTVANTGNVSLNTLRVFDNKLNQTLTISGSLAPGQSTSTIGTYTLTQADIDAGQVINTATVSALSPNSVAVTSNDSVSTTINRTPAISLDKVAGTPSSNSAGGTIRYTFTVANTGNVSLNTLRVFDNKLNQTLTISGSLAPGQSTSTIGTYTLTQADIDAGQVINTATVSALSPNSVAVTSSDSVLSNISRTPAITLDKVAGTPSSNSAGGTIRYTFTVANTGNVSLNTLRVFDNKLNQTLTISGSLAPGQSTSTIGTYTLTQADIDAGQVINTATVSALSPNSVAVTSNDSVSTTINRTPAISLDKVAGTPSSSSAGGTIRYTFTVANTGNVNLDTIRVFDNKLNQTLTISGSLAPGQSTSTIGTYTLTQADIDAGQVINTATVSALSPNSTQVTSSDSVLSNISRTPAITLDKVAGTPSSNSAGGTIRYTFTVANTGNVSLNTLRVFDNKLNQTLTISGSLAPGQSTSTIGTYTLTQADIDAGQVINTATVSALSPNSVAVTSNDSVSTTINRTPAISLDKVAGTPSSSSAGGTIRYTFTVANTGNVNLDTIRVFDNKLNQTLTISGSLAPGQSTSTIGTYTLTQADIDAGQVINTATVSALSPNSTQVTSSDSVLSNISRTPAITLDKVAGTPSSNSAGGTIRYTFTLLNTGNVNLSTLRVFDNKLNQTLTISGSLAPGQSTSTIGTYTLTQADIDAGQVINTATVSALSPNSVAVTSNDSVLSNISRTPAITLDKVAGSPSSNAVGGTIRYTFTVANTGNVNLDTIRVFDNKLNQTLTISGSLVPGQSASTIGTYTLTQADIDAGQVINTATVSALSPNSVAVTSNDSVSTTINRTPAISLDKVAGTPSSSSAGGTIRYTFTVANTGNVNLDTIRVFDNKLNQTLTISGSLAPGQSTSTIGTYTLTQADIDAGQVINTATVNALSPNSTQVGSNDSAVTSISSSPAISLDKVAGSPSSNVAGGTIVYSFNVTNTGNTTLDTIRVFDNKLNQTLTISGSLAPGQSTSTIGTYTLTQADIDAGQVINTATVSALSPNSVAVTSSDSVLSNISRTPAITLDKVAGTPSSNSAGGTIRYTFTVANTGNVSLNTLRVFDNKLNQTLTISGSLAPGQSTSTIGTYTLTQADIDAGQVINTATVSALSPNSVAVTSNDSVSTTINRTPAISLDKVAGTPSSSSAGGTIRYTFTVANTGNVNLDTIRVFDNKLNQTLTISGSLAPGQSTSTIGTYTLTQADIDAGQVINTATVSALSPNSTQVTSSDSVLSNISRTPAITLDKVAGTPSSNSAGGTIRYTFTLLNTGNVNLSTLRVFDNKLNQTLTISGSLAPGQSTSTIGTYTLTQADIDAGQVINTATVNALSPNSTQVGSNDSAVTSISSSPAISLDKVAGSPSSNAVGGTIRYTFTVANTGNVSLNTLRVFDNKLNQTLTISGSLAPGQSTSTIGTYTLTQADIDAGQVINTATVNALSPNSTQVTSSDSAVTSISSSPAISLDKVAGTPSSNSAGGTIRYTFTVANTGNVNLDTIRVFDNKLNQTLTISGSLAPGQSTSTTATYILTQADIDAGQVINTATVSALSPNSVQVTSNDSAVTAISSSPAISLDKVAGTPSSNAVGGTIRYTFTVANTGNVSLNTLRVFDNKLNQTLTISGTLNPGQSTSTIGTYTLTQADIDAGQVINTATVSALSPNSVQVTSNDSAVTAISSSPAITLDKVAGSPSSNAVGGTIRYTFTVANTGNVNLDTIRVFDNKLNQTLTISGTLNPGQSASTIGTYTLTQADIDAGQVINTATVNALSPNSTQVGSNDSAVTSISSSPAISLDKVAGTPSSNSAGGTIRYTFTVANTGNVNLDTIRVFDNKLNQTLTISGSLAPGQSTSTTATYILTQADIDAGQVINTATVSALSPNSVQVTSNDSAVTAISSSPAISLDKVAGTPSSNAVGGTIRYTFTVANTGNVSLNTLRVFDNKLNQTLTISGSLAPGQSASTIGTYTLTQADIDAGQVINTATVNALSPNSTQVTSSDSAVTSISSSPAISLDKVAGTPSSNSAGGTIRYTFTVANTGNVNLDTIRVFDNKLNQTLTISGSLAPGQSTSTTATYILTQADIDAGQVINTATVSALSPNSVQVTSNDSAVTAISSSPAISLDKVAGTPSSNAVGGTIRYTFTVANTGNVNLDTIRVFDNKLNQTLTISGTLNPGQSTSTIGTYTLTQADIDAGQVINTATVSALSPNSVQVTSNDSAVTAISSSPAITLDKVAGSPSSNAVGGTIRYTFTVANTGNVNLDTIRVFDNKLNQTLTISGTLNPGQSASTIGTYTLTQADIDAGQVINTATVNALSPNSTQVGSNDSAVTSISSSPAITLDKVAGSPSSNAVGGTIRYTFTVANTGNVNLDTIRVFDNKLNQTLTISGSLAPGQSTSTTATYILTQADIDAGQVINTATVNALSPNSTQVGSNDSAVTSISSSPAISLDKVAGTPSSNSAGGTIRYTFTVANTGNVNLDTIRVFDNKLNQTLTISGSLAPGQSTSTTATYILTQADIDAGQVINTATVSALSPNSVQVTSNDSAVTAISSSPAISLDKVAGTPSSNAVGGTIRYTFTVANTGNVSLNTLRVFDNKLNQTLTISGSLAPGQSASTIGTYTLTQADIDAGQVINTATVNALSPNSTQVTSSDSAVTSISSSPAISLDKVAGTPSSNSAGGTIRYTFTVANTGNVNLDTIRVFDNKLNQTLTISGSLAPGQSTSTTATYILTQADIDAGQVINTATVSALSPNSVQVTSNDSAVTAISSSPAISLDKVAGTPSSNAVGGTIRYTFTVANTGNVNLDTIRVFDNKLNQTLTISGTLNPGQSTSTIGTYTLTQADIDAGQVINTATVSALSPNSVQVTSNDSAVTAISSSPAITLDKVAGSPSSNAVGGTIRYTFTVANTGNVNLDTIRVFDNKLNQTLTISGTLNPGQSASTIGTYTLTQADIDAGQVINTATVNALSPNSTQVGSNDSAVTSISSSPAITLDKVAGSPSSNAVGGTIRYTFTVANTGNVNLDTIRVFDNKLNQTLTISGSLAPGQSTSTTATYILTQADIDAGQVINTATVNALSPNSTQVTSSDSAVTSISSSPAITLDKVAGTPSSNSAGGTIRYTFTVANTGNVNLDTIRVFDNKLNQTLTISGSLAPGQSTSTTATYILTQADIDAGQVINTATVSALSPNSVQVTSNDSAVTAISSSPAISLDKVAGTPSSNAVGGTIRYTFTVANTGNVSLNTLRVFDNKLNQTLTISGSLAPGQSTSTTATYILTQADIDAGQVINTATVNALSPNSTQVTSSDSAVTAISSSPAITLDKVAGTPSSNSAGGTIRYTFTVANTGNVSLNTLRVFDNKLNQTLTISGSLAPGQSTSTTATYILTQADIDAGQVINTATVNALSPNSTQVTSNDSAVTSISSSPAITLDKVAGTPSSNSAGGTIRYTFTVANTGNVSLNTLRVFDNKLNQTLTISGSLAPGQSTSTTATYILTQADIDAGQVINTATVRALSPNSVQVTSSDSAVTAISSSPAITLDKVAGSPSSNAVGGTIRYTFTVANTGNVNLDTIRVFDNKLNQTLTISGSLAPGQSASTIGTYTLTQADIDAGQVINTATVNALSPNSTQVGSNDSAVTSISSSPAITLDKVAGSPSSNAVGGTIRYTFTVANTGNVNLDTIRVFDNKLNQTLTISGTLNPGQSASTIGTYTLTQADIDAGQVINTATVNALSPNSTQVGSNDSAVTSISSSPAITLDKVAGSPSSNAAGGTIRYTFTVANIGNVNLDTIRVFDNKLNQTLTISGSLAPGQSTSTTATYILTQADIDAGQVINTATVNALSPNSTQVGSNDSAVTSISSSPAISLDKVAGSPSSNAVGGTIRYTFTVANTGNVNLDTIRVFDNKLNQTLTISGTLNPGQSASTIGTYTLTQADIDAGQVINTATVNALSPNSTQVGSNDSAVTSISSSPAISLDKVAGSPSSNAVGGTIRYTFTVANTGNVNLDTIRVFDNKLNQTLTISGSLAPGQSASTIGTYTLTQADIDAGQVINTATVNALSPNSTQVGSSDSAVTAISSSPAISLDKLAGSPSSNAAGGTIRYTFTVANTGNVSLNTLRVFDNKLNQTLTISGSLAPGQSTSTTATYILTQADVNAGQVINTASVSALSPNSVQVTSSDSAVTAISSSPAISLDKVAGSPSSKAVGGTIRYTFTVANTGNVNLDTIRVFDNKLNQTLTISGSLAPGQSASTIGTYTLTQADIDAGQVINTATVNALSPNSTAVSSSDSVTVDIRRITIDGTIWLDQNSDGQVNDNEYGISGYTINLYMKDSSATENTLLATQISDINGRYRFTDLTPNKAHLVEVRDSNGSMIKSFPLLAEELTDGASLNLLLPIDPSGVIYDSISLAPIAGVIVNLRHKSTGALYADRCLIGSKNQGQVTGSDGRYEFFVNIADASCLSPTDVLTLEVIPVLGYSRSVNIPVRAGAVNQGDCTVGGSSVDAVAGTRMCEIQAQSTAPVSTATTATPYYLDFIIPDSTARDIIHNHIPLDPPRPLAQADTYTVSAGAIVTASVVVNDEINPYLVGSPTYTVEIVTGTVSDPNNGTLTLASNGLMRYEAPLGTVLPVTFTYRITQNDGNTTQAQVRILLTASDHVLFNVTKQVNKKAVSIGDVVRYQIEINPRETYTQSRTVSLLDRLPAGLSLVADSLRLTQISGSGVRGAAVAMANGSQASGQIKVSWGAELGARYELTYFVRINAGATLGEKKNRAQLWDTASGSVISNLAQVSIEIEEDPILDKLTVIGKVFNDVNQNGVQDEELGELGLPGVRVISLSGQVITTDGHGRFNVPAVSAGSNDRGRNYLLKVDAASLPEGYVFTTENPRVLRITPGLLTRMNFGVYKPLRVKAALKFKVIENCTSKQQISSVREEIAPVYFASGYHQVNEKTIGQLADVLARYQSKANVRLQLTGYADLDSLTAAGKDKYISNEGLSKARAEIVGHLLAERLDLAENQLLIEGRGAVRHSSVVVSEAQKQKDRRTEIQVLYEDIESTENCEQKQENVSEQNLPNIEKSTPKKPGDSKEKKEGTKVLYFDYKNEDLE